MKISVKAKPAAKEEKVEQIDDVNFTVSVKEPPVQGRANAAIAKALAQHFKVSNSQVKLVSGFASKQKIFEINER
jgi:uncharacterized protein (TIGR00251 family)